jgi:hypothetical protein
MKQRLYDTALLILLAAVSPHGAVAQGTTTKPKAAEYPVHARLHDMEIGVEYMVRSFGADQIMLADDFLVTEVAIYPAYRAGVELDARKFTMRINGKKEVLFAQSPGAVAASLKYPDWQRKPQLSVGAGMGDRGIILGRPQQVERFPGDRRAEPRLPAPPRVPTSDTPAAAEPVDLSEMIHKVALPEGVARFPVSGYLFFPYRGKLKSLKRVELLVETGLSEPVVLRLR